MSTMYLPFSMYKHTGNTRLALNQLNVALSILRELVIVAAP